MESYTKYFKGRNFRVFRVFRSFSRKFLPLKILIFFFCKRDTTFSSNEIIVEKMSFLRKMRKEKTASEKEVEQANKIVNMRVLKLVGVLLLMFSFTVFYH